jgi:hypothetical protein
MTYIMPLVTNTEATLMFSFVLPNMSLQLGRHTRDERRPKPRTQDTVQ